MLNLCPAHFPRWSLLRPTHVLRQRWKISGESGKGRTPCFGLGKRLAQGHAVTGRVGARTQVPLLTPGQAPRGKVCASLCQSSYGAIFPQQTPQAARPAG